MAVIKVHRKAGWAWKATIRDAAGRQISETFPYDERLKDAGKSAAQRWETARLIEKEGGRPALVRRGLPTFEAFGREVLAKHVGSDNSLARHWSNFEVHLVPVLGDLRVDRVTREHCQQLIDGARNANTGQPLAATTKHVLSATLLIVMGAATTRFSLGSNPASELALPKYRRKKKPRHLEDDQLAALLGGAVTERWKRVYRIGAGLGLRQGELLALGANREDIDMRARTYEVARQVVTKRGVKPFLTEKLKTEASYRTLPMSRRVCKDMQWLLDHTPPGQPFLLREDGSFYSRQAANRRWGRAIRAAGLDKRISSQALRHTYASLLIRAGLDLLTVSRRLGHASIDETTDTYGHLMRKADKQVADAVDRFLKQGRRRNARRAA